MNGSTHRIVPAQAPPLRRASRNSVAPVDGPPAEDENLDRRISRRLAPIQVAFPASHNERARTTFVPRRSSELVSKDYLTKLRVLFDICDGNGEGTLTPRELVMLLGLMGMDERDAIVLSAADATHCMTFDAFKKQYHSTMVTFSASHTLPRDDFVLQCKRLRHGFTKIDGDRDGGMTRLELEIATQKLHLTLSDAELDGIYTVLDRDHDGRVEWADFVFSAYYNTLAPAVATLDEAFSIGMFADLPSFIRQGSNKTPVAATGPTPNAIVVTPIERRLSKRLSSFASTRRKASIDRSSTNTSLGRKDSTTKSTIERIGIEFLTRTSMQHVAQSKRQVSITSRSRRLDNDKSMTSRRFDNEKSMTSRRFDNEKSTHSTRRQTTFRTGFSVYVRRRIQWIEATAVGVGALAGILCGLISVGFESLLTEDRTPSSYAFLVIINVAVSILEVHGIYLTAVISAFRLTTATNLRLYPQDAEREFLTRAIARAALQVGHRKEKLFGIDPRKHSPRAVLCMSFMVYKTKRYVVKLILKHLIKRVLWRAAAKSALSLMVLPINGIMNAWTLRSVMLNCRVSIIGPPCVVSLLEAFSLQDDLVSPYQRVDYIRILGVSLVCKRSIHPNVEIMIEHMRRQWLKPELWPVSHDCMCLDATDEPCPRHSLDDMDLLLASLKLYASQIHGPDGPAVAQHLRNMFFFLIITLIVDGSVDWTERRLFVRLCNAARLQNSWDGVLHVKDDFVLGKGIHTDAVMALIHEVPIEQQGVDDLQLQERVPWRESALYSAQRIAQLLVW